jgi:dihydropteroate synthase
MRTLVMGVVNVTPDSFFDGGRYLETSAAIAHGHELIAAGADIVDVGGESTRPGAQPVGLDEELRRVLPVVEALAPLCRVSIDTMKPEVARAAAAAGATLLNDVAGTLAPVAAASGCGLVVMHMRGTPATMQRNPRYDDVVAEVGRYLAAAANAAHDEGVEEVYVDPGIGFGKTAQHNLALLAALPALVAAGEPVLVGVSRKQFIGRLAAPAGDEPLPADERFEGSLALAVHAMTCGATVVRVHDVAPTRDAAVLVAAALAARDAAELSCGASA